VFDRPVVPAKGTARHHLPREGAAGTKSVCLCVCAYGTWPARTPRMHILLYRWPCIFETQHVLLLAWSCRPGPAEIPGINNKDPPPSPTHNVLDKSPTITCCEIYTHCSFGVYHFRPTNKSRSQYVIFCESSAISEHCPATHRLVYKTTTLRVLPCCHHAPQRFRSLSVPALGTNYCNAKASVRQTCTCKCPIPRLENSLYSLLSELSLHRILSWASLSRIRVTLNESNPH
jgi:hypothetical protein